MGGFTTRHPQAHTPKRQGAEWGWRVAENFCSGSPDQTEIKFQEPCEKAEAAQADAEASCLASLISSCRNSKTKVKTEKQDHDPMGLKEPMLHSYFLLGHTLRLKYVCPDQKLATESVEQGH